MNHYIYFKKIINNIKNFKKNDRSNRKNKFK